MFMFDTLTCTYCLSGGSHWLAQSNNDVALVRLCSSEVLSCPLFLQDKQLRDVGDWRKNIEDKSDRKKMFDS